MSPPGLSLSLGQTPSDISSSSRQQNVSTLDQIATTRSYLDAAMYPSTIAPPAILIDKVSSFATELMMSSNMSWKRNGLYEPENRGHIYGTNNETNPAYGDLGIDDEGDEPWLSMDKVSIVADNNEIMSNEFCIFKIMINYCLITVLSFVVDTLTNDYIYNI